MHSLSEARGLKRRSIVSAATAATPLELAIVALYEAVNPCSYWASESDGIVTIVRLGLYYCRIMHVLDLNHTHILSALT